MTSITHDVSSVVVKTAWRLLAGVSLSSVACLAAAAASAQANSAQQNQRPTSQQPTTTAPSLSETADTPPEAADTGTSAALSNSDDQNAAGSGEVIVTGSRVRANGFQNPTPVTAISQSDLTTKAPSNIPDALNQLPQFVNSTSPTKSESRLNLTPVVGNFLNLRGLTPRRTLVMLDSVRVPPTSFDGSVDVNTLPQMLVQRVDVVTGGASAAYGSDAVVGVVNFVLDKKFEGIRAVAQAGVADRGDVASHRVGLAAGVKFLDDRLRLIGSVERYDTGGLANRDRPLGDKQTCTVGTGTAANPYNIRTGCRFNTPANGGKTVGGGLLNNYVFLGNGVIKPFNAGGVGGVGGDGAILDSANTIAVPLKTLQGFGRVSYEASPAFTVFAQASVTQSNAGPIFLPDGHYANQPSAITIFADNAYLPAAARALLTTPSFQLNYIGDQRTAANAGGSTLDLQEARQRIRSLNAIVGAEGTFGKDWTWNLNFVHGRSQVYSHSRESELPKLVAAADAVRDTNGNIVCRVTITNPGLYPGCVPINLFGPAGVTREANNYVFGISEFRTTNSLSLAAANLSGSLFDLPYGPVSVSVGGEYRRQKLRQTSNADPSLAIDRTGLRGAFPAITRFQLTNAARASGNVTVKEAYAEAVVPILANLPFAELLEFNAAGRYTDYTTSGSVETWKLGFNYKPVDGVRFRGTISRDIRAPSLYELFAGPSNSVTTLADPHTSTTTIVQTSVVSNSTLTPEKGLTKIIGLVFQPKFLPGFGASIDAYDIKISDAIVASSAVTNVQLCETSNGTGPECALVIRPLPFSDRSPANFPSLVRSQPLNLANVRQRGLDIEVGYRFSLSSIADGLGGTLDIRGFANHVPRYDQQQSPTLPVQNYAGYLFNAKWRGSLSETYTNDSFSLNVQQRFTGTYKMPVYQNASVYADYGVAPNRTYTDLTLTIFAQQKKAEFFVNVLNLFDVQPPLLNPSATPDLGYATVKQTYDVVGRYFTAGFRARF